MDKTNIADLKKIIDLCKKTGVESIKLGDLELKFTLQAVTPRTRSKRNKEFKENEPQYSEQELLYWSAGQLEEAYQ
jgi:hypothetical protein